MISIIYILLYYCIYHIIYICQCLFWLSTHTLQQTKKPRTCKVIHFFFCFAARSTHPLRLIHSRVQTVSIQSFTYRQVSLTVIYLQYNTELCTEVLFTMYVLERRCPQNQLTEWRETGEWKEKQAMRSSNFQGVPHIISSRLAGIASFGPF